MVFEKLKEQVESLRNEIQKELEDLYKWDDFLYSLKKVIDYG